MSIFIGGAWPYANGSLHIGHIASLLPGDVLARYFRLKNERVLYVSGSDCHGTPISIRAKQENKSPAEVADFFHAEFKDCFEKLGFTYDLYSKTSTDFHKAEVQRLFLKLLENGYIYQKEIDQTFCEKCNQFLPDRYIEGSCPHCGSKSNGDQCDNCCSIFSAIDLKDKKCKLCGSESAVRKTEHFYFALSKFQSEIEAYVEGKKGCWRENAVDLTERYLKEGLVDRAATRDLDLGISAPIDGYENKKIYVWIEAVCGYLTASKLWAQNAGESWEEFWKVDVTAYYVHGKDNIPFHTIILPGILLGVKEDLHLPDRIISSEFLNLEGRKISTSKNWAVWLPYLISKYNPDSVRYFLISNAPEKRDANFSWREFIYSHNSDLLGCFGNFVNRNIPFLDKHFNRRICDGIMDENIQDRLKNLYNHIGDKIEAGEFKNAANAIFDFVRDSNKYFDETKPWILVKEDLEQCKHVIYTCFQIIVNLSILLEPFIPFSCKKIKSFLGLPKQEWKYIEVKDLQLVGEVGILFDRIDKKVIEEETKALGTDRHEQ